MPRPPHPTAPHSTDYTHVHAVTGGDTTLTTITTSKRYPLVIGARPGVQLANAFAPRFKHVQLVNDEAYSGAGVHL